MTLDGKLIYLLKASSDSKSSSSAKDLDLDEEEKEVPFSSSFRKGFLYWFGIDVLKKPILNLRIERLKQFHISKEELIFTLKHLMDFGISKMAVTKMVLLVDGRNLFNLENRFSISEFETVRKIFVKDYKDFLSSVLILTNKPSSALKYMLIGKLFHCQCLCLG